MTLRPGLSDRVRLGRSDLRISRVGVGTAPMGSSPGWHVNWGPQDEGSSIRAIETALDQGVNWIDTAPFYGWGRSEEIVGRAVRERRDEVLIFTKCGSVPDGKGRSREDLSRGNIWREVEASLRRLQTDHIDLLQFHDPDPETPIEESWGTMQELIRDGRVRYGGLSNHPVELVERALKIGPVTSLQVQYNPLERSIEKELMPFCHQNGIGMLGWGSLAEGFLADDFDLDGLDVKDFRRTHSYAREENYAKIGRVREGLVGVARKHGKKLVDLVVAWELMHPGLTGAIIGIRDEREAREMMGGVGWVLDREEMEEIDRVLSVWRN